MGSDPSPTAPDPAPTTSRRRCKRCQRLISCGWIRVAHSGGDREAMGGGNVVCGQPQGSLVPANATLGGRVTLGPADFGAELHGRTTRAEPHGSTTHGRATAAHLWSYEESSIRVRMRAFFRRTQWKKCSTWGEAVWRDGEKNAIPGVKPGGGMGSEREGMLPGRQRTNRDAPTIIVREFEEV